MGFNKNKDGFIFRVPYVSVWDGGIEVETSANVNTKTGEVTGIKVVNISGLEICELEYIVMNDERIYVYDDARGFEKWADILNEGMIKNE